MPSIVIVSGYVDSDVRVANVGTPPKKVANFRVNDGSGWVSVAAWEALADKVPPKGAPLIVHGRLSTRSYEKDGVKMYATEVVASMIDQVAGPAVAPARTGDVAGDNLFGD